MGFRFPQPDNEDGFEQMCLRYYRKLWSNESLQLYAKRGEKQDGIDIHDPACLPPIRAVQCKHHEPTKNLEPAEIKAEVLKAENSVIPIEQYVIATTAKKSKNAQNEIVELNSRSDKKFSVEIHFWEEICQGLSGFTPFQAHFIAYGRDAVADLLATVLQDPQIAALASRALVALPAESGIDEFSEIEQLFVKRNLQAAAYEISKLPCDEGLLNLPPNRHYKILRLRGKLELELGNFERASAYFLAAFDQQPNLEQAKQNRVLAYSLTGNASLAFEMASQYVKEGIVNPMMICRVIENASCESELARHQPLINSFIQDNSDVCLAMCHKLLQLEDTQAAVEVGERAVTISPESAHAHFAAGMANQKLALGSSLAERNTRLLVAFSHYDTAAAISAKEHYMSLLPEALNKRAGMHVLLGRAELAKKDYLEAVKVAQKPAAYAAHAVSYLLHLRDFVDARELLGHIDKSEPEGIFLAAVTEFHNTNDEVERRRFLQQLKSLTEIDWSRAIECHFHCVHLAILLKDTEYARSCITDSFKQRAPFQAEVALSWIAWDSNERDLALKHAESALAQDVRNAHTQELQLLAELLTKLEQHAKALDILENIATPGVFSEETKLLLTCAQRLERHDLLLRICRELRLAGEKEEQLFRLELKLLNRYSPDVAFQLVDWLIENSDDPKYYRAFKNSLAIRLNRMSEVDLDLTKLPAPSELDPRESQLVVGPFLACRKFDEAISFLHRILRENFDDEDTHGNYVTAFLSYGAKSSFRERPTEAAIGNAVLLEYNDGRQRWVSIENDQPVPSRSEFASTSAIASCLIGRRIGDEIELPGNFMTTERATIVELQTKYVRSFQDCLQFFKDRFPDTSFLQHIKLGSGEDFDPAILIAILKERRDYVEQCIEDYKTSPLSIYLFGNKVGLNELESIKALAQHPNGVIKCCETTHRDYEIAANAGLTTSHIVLDICAIATLHLTDSWESLDKSKRYFVGSSTKNVFSQWIIDLEGYLDHEGGHVSVTEDGRVIFEEKTKAQRDEKISEIQEILGRIEQICEVKSSESVASIEPPKRETLEKILGFHNLEAMCLAGDLNATLWTDDCIQAFVAKNELQVPCVWTQLAFGQSVVSEKMEQSKHDLVSAKLISWKYTQIVWNAGTIIQAGEHANWDTNAWPLKQCIELLAKSSNLPLPHRTRIALNCLKGLRRTSCPDFVQSGVVQSILRTIGNRRAVRWMLSRLDTEFFIDVFSAEFLRHELEYWLDNSPFAE